MDTDLSSHFKEKYFDAIWNDIKNQCVQLNQSEIEIYERQIDVPWFGDVENAWLELNEYCSDKIWKHFPANIGKNRLSEIVTELHYILPKTVLVKSFLPILLSSYVTNRKSNLLKALTDEPFDSDQIELKKGLWSTSSLKDTYSKLIADNVSLTSLDRGLSVYSKIIQFFVFVKATSDKCNVVLSFLGFEAMTGYLHLLGADARNYINESSRAMLNQALCISNGLDQEIMQYIEGIIQGVAVTEGENSWQPPFELLIFLYNLKCELSPNADISLAEDDPLEIAHRFDFEREAYLKGDVLSVFGEIYDEACEILDFESSNG